MNKYNWHVVVYDASINKIDEWIITDRTEHEAENEAMSDLPANCIDWTMMKCN